MKCFLVEYEYIHNNYTERVKIYVEYVYLVKKSATFEPLESCYHSYVLRDKKDNFTHDIHDYAMANPL